MQEQIPLKKRKACLVWREAGVERRGEVGGGRAGIRIG